MTREKHESTIYRNLISCTATYMTGFHMYRIFTIDMGMISVLRWDSHTFPMV